MPPRKLFGKDECADHFLLEVQGSCLRCDLYKRVWIPFAVNQAKAIIREGCSMNAPVEVIPEACSNLRLHVRTSQSTDEFQDVKLDPRRKVRNLSRSIDSLEFLKKPADSQQTKSSAVDVDTYCCSISTSSTSVSTVAPKRVTFAFDNKGRVQCEYYRNYEPRNRKEVLASWYNPSQFMAFRKECRMEAIMISKSSYCQNFAAVYEACNTGNFKSVTKQRAYVSAASCRGLEVVVFPTLHHDRKNAIHPVLKTQEALPRDMPVEKRQDALASASRFLSKKARQLARILGSGDAAVVVANERISAANDKATNKPVMVPQLFTGSTILTNS
jgi:hypothetical protein